MNDKARLLSAAREIIVEDEKLKILLKEGKIGQSTFDDKHREITGRLAEIKEEIAGLERKKGDLVVPASVEKFNDSFARRHPAGDRNIDKHRSKTLKGAGRAAALSGLALVLGVLFSPKTLYSSLPVPESYGIPDSAGLFVYAAVLAAQVFAGGWFFLLIARNAAIPSVDYLKARKCTAEGAIIVACFLFLTGFLPPGEECTLIRISLGTAAGVLAYFWAAWPAFETTKLKAAILSASVYVLNYFLSIAVPVFIIILLGLNT